MLGSLVSRIRAIGISRSWEIASMIKNSDGAGPHVSPGFLKLLGGYGLTTAEILYHMPDHPAFLQTFVWQDYDIAPEFPCLIRFLDFWRKELDGALHSVRVGHSKLLKPAELTLRTEFGLH